jgi:hypothetical protein
MKKINHLLIILFMLLNNCGFKPTINPNNISFKINNIEFGDSNLDKLIANNLKRLSNDNSKNLVDVKIKSKKEITILSKDKSNKAKNYRMKITTQIQFSDISKTFSAEQIYDNNDDKFFLGEYQKVVEKQLFDKVMFQVINYLPNLK